MDNARFNSLARRMSPSGTRRRALAAIVGSGLGILGIGDTAARKRRKGKNTCRSCLRGRTHLANGSCARVCTRDSDCAGPLCICSNFSLDHIRYCTPFVDVCTDIPQTCTSKAACPLGQVCLDFFGECGTARCTPLCA